MKKNERIREEVGVLGVVFAFLVDFLGYAFIVPILPSWKQEFDLSNTEATALVSLWAVPLFLLGPKTGRITDRLGAGRTILFSLFCLTGASLLYLIAMKVTFVDGFIILAIARLIHGLSGAAISNRRICCSKRYLANKIR